MEIAKFVVDETPYAFWDLELQKKNLEFIEGIDAEYFRYVAESSVPYLKGDDKQRAALALRLSYSQGLEALLALLCSLVQSAECVIGWMTSYKNSELKDLVRKISRHEDVYSRLKGKPVTWALLAQCVHSNLNFDECKLSWIQKGFGKLWEGFAADFLEEGISDEYNGIKHGLRTRPGGFYLALGREDTPGVPAPQERMQTVGGSEFGTFFFTRETIIPRNYINFRPKGHFRNWNPENLAEGLRLLSVSINNVVSCLRVLNGVKRDKCRFITPATEEAFQEPWKHSVGVDSVDVDITLEPSNITPLTKEDILKTYK